MVRGSISFISTKKPLVGSFIEGPDLPGAGPYGRATNSENLTASSILDLRTYLFDTQKDFWSDRYVLTTNYNYYLLQ